MRTSDEDGVWTEYSTVQSLTCGRLGMFGEDWDAVVPSLSHGDVTAISGARQIQGHDTDTAAPRPVRP